MATPVLSPSSPTLAQIQSLYFYLDQNFDDLYSLCQSNAQRTALRSDYISARDTFYATVNKIIVDSDPLIASESNQLQVLTDKINNSELGLETISTVLQYIADAVQLATKLAAVAAV